MPLKRILHCSRLLKQSCLISCSLIVGFTLNTSQVLAKNMTMRAAQFEAGGPEKLYIGEAPVPCLREKEVLIKVFATAINRAETLQRQGKYPPLPGESAILGLECAGTVDKLGPGALRWKVGDRVMALLPGGGNAEYVAGHEDHLMPVPSKVSFIQAAAIPEAWLTAYQLVHLVGKVQPGERVLVHAGASGVGTAAVQLIRLAGSIPYVTAGSTEKIEYAKSMGAEAGFDYKTGSFSTPLLEATGGEGVHVILDCVGASFWEQNTDALAVDGRWVLYGGLGGLNVEGPILGKILRKRINLIGSLLKARTAEYKSTLISEFTQNALPHFADGKLKTCIDVVYPSLDKLSDAHRMMEANQNKGKIVVQVREEAGHSEL